jgi:hypothetical protein
MPTLNEQEYASLALQGYTGTLNEMEYAWLFDQCSPTPSGPPTASSDACILWGTGSNFTATYVEDGGFSANCNLYFYEGPNGQPGPTFPSSCGYWIYNGVDDNNPAYQAVICEAETPFSTDEFIVKFDVVQVISGTAPVQLLYTPGREGEYWEMFRCDIRIDDDVFDGTPQEVIVDITVARLGGGDPNAGTATPIAGTEGVVRVTLYAERTV